jgi:hypothetical protein
VRDSRGFDALVAAALLLSAAATTARAQTGVYDVRRSSSAQGERAVELRRNGVPLDTIDATFGWHGVRGGIVYRDRDGRALMFASADGTPQTVESIVSAYRDRDALVALIDSVIMFWSFAPDPGGGFHVRAVRHDFGAARSDTATLYSDYLDARNPAHYQPPAPDGDLIIFRVDGAALWLGRDWRIERRRGRD